MNVHVFQHVPFEGVGSMDSWFNAREAKVTYSRFFELYQLPDITDIDLLVVMGGPMSVTDVSSYQWLKEESAFILKSIRTGVPVLGICLGAQLIAYALDAQIFANKYNEIGWFPVESVNDNCDMLPFPKRFPAFHWHGDTFDLPKGAIHLMRSEGCQNQGFMIKKNVIGLQFHLETRPKEVEKMIVNCGDDMIDGPYVQSPKAIREATVSYADLANVILSDTLDYLTS